MSIHDDHFRDQQGLFTRLAQDNGSYQGYLADLLEVWKAADAQTRQQLRDGLPPISFAECIRYALIYSTIVGNLRKRYPLPSAYSDDADKSQPLSSETLFKHMAEFTDEFVGRTAVKAPDEISDPSKRADVLIELMERDPDADRALILRSAIDSILAIQESYWEFPDTLWERLASFLNDDLTSYVPAILSASNDIARAWFISVFAKTMPHELRRAAVRSALQIHDPVARGFTLRRLLERSRRKQRVKILRAMYQTAGKITEPRWRSRILVELVGKLEGEQRSRVIKLAVATIPLVAGSERGRDADRLLPYLNELEKEHFLEAVLDGKGVISQLEATLILWSHLSKQSQEKALKIALEIQDPQSRAKYLAKVAAKLQSKAAYREIVQEISSAILSIRNEDNRWSAIQAVQRELHDDAIERIAKLPIERLTPNFETLLGYRFAFAERDRQYVAYALGNLADFMSEARRAQVQPLMVDLALEIDLHDYVAEAIEHIAPYLDEYYLGKALDGALQIDNGWSQVWALCGLASFLKGEQHKMCLDAAVSASGLTDDDYQTDAWFTTDMAVRLLPHIKGRVRDKILTHGLEAAAASDYKEFDVRIRFLPYLDGERQTALVDAILNTLPKLADSAKAHTLSEVARFLPVYLVDSSIRSAQAIDDEYQRESVLSDLIPHMSDVDAALKLITTLEDPYRKAVALTGLLDQLSGGERHNVLQRTIATTESVEAVRHRIDRWLALLPYVDDPASMRRLVIEEMLHELWVEKDRRRKSVLAICADQELVSATLFPMEVLREIGEHVMQVCMEWKW